MTTHTNTIATEHTSRNTSLTIEGALWGGIALAALAIRLATLTRVPLNDAEATQALAALNIYRGGTPTGEYSPLLASITSAAFVLFGATDWAARLANALLGTALVLLPLGLRRELGRIGALAAAFLLTFTAIPLFFSHTANGDMAAAVGALLALVGFTRFLNDRNPRGLFAVGGGAALVLTAGASGFTVLAMALAGVALIVTGNRNVLDTLSAQFAAERKTVRRAALWFGTLVLILATAGTFNFGGAGMISQQFTLWLSSFGITPRPGGALPAILNIIVYEPLLLILGGIGLARAITGKNIMQWTLTAWLALAVLLDIFMAGRTDGQILLAIVPLALLAGTQIESIWHTWRTGAKLESDGVLVGIGLVVSAFVYISGMSWSLCTSAQAGCDTSWILPGAGILLIFGLAIMFGSWYGRETAFRGLAALALIAFGVLSIGFSWRLNFGKLYDLPFEPVQILPASSRLPDLLGDLEKESMHRVGDPREIDIAVVDVDTPQLRWVLRDFRAARFVPDFATAAGASIVLARPPAGEPAGNYLGEEFALVSFWSPAKLQGKGWLRWYITRHLPKHNPGHDQIVLWVQNG